MSIFQYIINSAFALYNRKNYKAFSTAVLNVEYSQKKILLSILQKNKDCEFGKQYDFTKIKSIKDFQDNVPESVYSDYELYIKRIMAGKTNVLSSEPIEYFALSSGSSASSKFIPYTKSLKTEFSNAINAWLYNLFTDNSKLKFGKQLWIITPNTDFQKPESKIPIGFEVDSNYFGGFQQKLINKLMAVPEIITRVKDSENYFYILSYFLVQSKELRLISVWNPSLLISIINAINTYFDKLINDLENGTLSLPNPEQKADYQLFAKHIKTHKKRARELKQIQGAEKIKPLDIWANLELISCWTDSWAKVFLPQIEKLFPEIKIQGKGLLATEAAITIPIEGAEFPVLVPNAHFYEFKNTQNNRFCLANELIENEFYEIFITTGGGFYRYSLNDIVQMKGYYKKSPMLKFIGKKDKVSDITGEKINEEHIERIINYIADTYLNTKSFTFVGIGKQDDKYSYIIFIESANLIQTDCIFTILGDLEKQLSENYHYKHSRQMKQLNPVGLCLLNDKEIQEYQKLKTKKEFRSTFKFSRLETDIELLSKISGKIHWLKS